MPFHLLKIIQHYETYIYHLLTVNVSSRLEINNTHINFVTKKAGSAMTTRPTSSALLSNYAAALVFQPELFLPSFNLFH